MSVVNVRRSGKKTKYDPVPESERLSSLDEDEKSEKVPSGPSIDELSHRLSSGVYITQWTWPWLERVIAGRMTRMIIDRFYPQINVAVDLGNVDLGEVEVKKSLFKSNGIQYANLSSGMAWSDLVSKLME